MNFRADLHCHTSCSDGTLSPVELILHAKEIGLQGISITDHDSIAAYDTAVDAAHEAGILLGAGIEFSCDHEGHSVHILGYDVDLKASSITELCNRHAARRTNRNRAILEKLKKKNFFIDEEELKAHFQFSTLGRPHIAMLMIEKGYVKSLPEAFNLYLAEGKSCFASVDTVSVEETIAIIHQGRGKAFLAHPHGIKQQRLIKSLLKLPFNGIECYYSKCVPNLEEKWIKIAKEKGLLISGGSDFHGETNTKAPLGASWVDEATFHLIFQHLL
jgi:3',5'-nucleoside bisphosphate phosphatase